MLQLLEPCWRAGLEGTGWSQDVEDTEQLAGTRGRAVMDEGTGGRHRAVLFWGQGPGSQDMAWGVGAVPGSLPVRAAAPCSTWRGQGQGFPSLPRKVKRAQRGGAACRTEQSSSDLAEKSKWEPCALQRSYLDPVQHGIGEGLGQGHWESILGGTHWFCSTKAGGSI